MPRYHYACRVSSCNVCHSMQERAWPREAWDNDCILRREMEGKNCAFIKTGAVLFLTPEGCQAVQWPTCTRAFPCVRHELDGHTVGKDRNIRWVRNDVESRHARMTWSFPAFLCRRVMTQPTVCSCLRHGVSHRCYPQFPTLSFRRICGAKGVWAGIKVRPC